MASRKEQKEQARARRLAEEQARAERDRRNRRLQMLGGTVLVAVAAIAGAIAISSGGSSTTTGLQKGGALTSTETTVKTLLTGIPQSGNVLGSPTAPVTMLYYGDLECPICQAFTLQGGFSQLVSNDVRKGKVKVQYLGFETATRDPAVFKTQQIAALAAGKQDQFWYYAELFYHEQGAEDSGYVTEPFLRGLAQQTSNIAGLNVADWQSQRSDSALASQVTTDMNQGTAAQVGGTPTLIMEGPKGKSQVPSSVPSYSDLEAAIKSVT